jgi:hypothetical protein
MNILFIGRLDYPPKQGGDAVQIENYKNIISQKGHQVEIASLTDEPGTYDFVHLFNISRIYDLVYQLEYKVRNKPILVLHTIHQKKEYLDNIRASGVKTGRNKKLKFIIRNILSKKFKLNQLWLLFRNEKKLLHCLLERIAFFHFLSGKEREWFEEDFGIKIDNEKVIIFGNTVRHGVENAKNLNVREIDILIPGRIEPQKNSINTANALSLFTDKKIFFVGQLNRYYKDYCNQFLKIIEQNKNLIYTGSKNFAEMEELYDNSKIVLSLSLSEVAPLVELEALAHRAVFIGTNRSASADKNMDACYHLDPENLNETVETINSVFEKIGSDFEFTFPRINTWEDEMQPLLSLYDKFEK